MNNAAGSVESSKFKVPSSKFKVAVRNAMPGSFLINTPLQRGGAANEQSATALAVSPATAISLHDLKPLKRLSHRLRRNHPAEAGC
jgi:hypothetical protein